MKLDSVQPRARPRAASLPLPQAPLISFMRRVIPTHRLASTPTLPSIRQTPIEVPMAITLQTKRLPLTIRGNHFLQCHFRPIREALLSLVEKQRNVADYSWY